MDSPEHPLAIPLPRLPVGTDRNRADLYLLEALESFQILGDTIFVRAVDVEHVPVKEPVDAPSGPGQERRKAEILASLTRHLIRDGFLAPPDKNSSPALTVSVVLANDRPCLSIKSAGVTPAGRDRITALRAGLPETLAENRKAERRKFVSAGMAAGLFAAAGTEAIAGYSIMLRWMFGLAP